jgi:hypothetical protein
VDSLRIEKMKIMPACVLLFFSSDRFVMSPYFCSSNSTLATLCNDNSTKMVETDMVASNSASSTDRRKKKTRPYRRSDKHVSDSRRSFIKESLLAFLGSEMTPPSEPSSKGNPTHILADSITQHTARSSRCGVEEDCHPPVGAPDAKSNATRSKKIFSSIFKSPINQRRKKILAGEIARENLDKEMMANAAAVKCPGLMVPDFDDTITTSGNSTSDPLLISNGNKTRGSTPIETSKQTNHLAYTREKRRGRRFKKKEPNVKPKDRSAGLETSPAETEMKTDDMIGGEEATQGKKFSTFENLDGIDWGNLEWGTIGEDSLFRHQRGRRRASCCGQPSHISLDTAPKGDVDGGPRHLKAMRPMSCSRLVSKIADWGDAEHQTIKGEANPEHSSMNDDAKKPSMRKLRSRRCNKSLNAKGCTQAQLSIETKSKFP